MARVLIVDEDAGIRRVLAGWLAASGHSVDEAPDPEWAARVLRTAPVDVVICDVQVPGRDGLWLATEIRRWYPAVGVVFATTSLRLPAPTLRRGVVAYLRKPFERSEVLMAIARAVEWQQARTMPVGPFPPGAWRPHAD